MDRNYILDLLKTYDISFEDKLLIGKLYENIIKYDKVDIDNDNSYVMRVSLAYKNVYEKYTDICSDLMQNYNENNNFNKKGYKMSYFIAIKEYLDEKMVNLEIDYEALDIYDSKSLYNFAMELTEVELMLNLPLSFPELLQNTLYKRVNNIKKINDEGRSFRK